MPNPPDPRLGAVLGDRYELLRSLGTAGGGAAYEARDRVLERPVAVRVYPAASDAERAHFAEEARRATERDDPRVFDSGSSGDESYLVLELAAGVAADRDATIAMPMVGGLDADPTGELTTILPAAGGTAVLPTPTAGDPNVPLPRRSRELPIWGAVLGMAVALAAVVAFAALRSSGGGTPTPTTVLSTTTITEPHRATTTTSSTEVTTTIPTTTSTPDTSSTTIPSTTTTLSPPTSALGLAPASVKQLRKAGHGPGRD